MTEGSTTPAREWPLSLEDTQEIVAHLLNDGSREGLILGDRLNTAMGASARRMAERTDQTPVQFVIQRQLICDCCGRAEAKLPYHHDAKDGSAMSWDYCQACYDAGCDLATCSRPS